MQLVHIKQCVGQFVQPCHLSLFCFCAVARVSWALCHTFREVLTVTCGLSYIWPRDDSVSVVNHGGVQLWFEKHQRARLIKHCNVPTAKHYTVKFMRHCILVQHADCKALRCATNQPCAMPEHGFSCGTFSLQYYSWGNGPLPRLKKTLTHLRFDIIRGGKAHHVRDNCCNALSILYGAWESWGSCPLCLNKL